MKPIGPLMTEHRLIERAIVLLKEEIDHFESEKELNASMLSVLIDFLKTYSDRTHHGKEEAILFRELAKKKLSEPHSDTMEQLIRDHNYARKTVNELQIAFHKYNAGDASSVRPMIVAVKELVKFYPAHIQMEDKHFFYPVLDYFTKEEQDAMLAEFWEFDRKLIHEKYEQIVGELERETM